MTLNMHSKLMCLVQVKRTDELSRKMRFFTDQVEKSGVIPGARSGAIDALNMDELEVSLDMQTHHSESSVLVNPLCILCMSYITARDTRSIEMRRHKPPTPAEVKGI